MQNPSTRAELDAEQVPVRGALARLLLGRGLIALWAAVASGFVAAAVVLVASLMPGYAALERQFVEGQLERASEFVLDRLGALETRVVDWSQQAAPYEFLRGRDARYANDYDATTLRSIGVDVALLADPRGVPALGLALDGEFDAGRAPGPPWTAALAPGSPLLPASGAAARAGLLAVDGAAYLVAVAAVRPSVGRARVAGHQLFAVRVRPSLGAALQQRLGTRARIEPAAPADDRDGALVAAPRETRDRPAPGQRVLAGLDGRPALRLIVDADRKAFDAGLRSMALAIGGLGLLLLAGGIAGHLLLVRARRLDDRHRALERRYRALVDQASDGIALVDPASGAIVQANPGLARLIGAIPADIGTLLPRDLLASLGARTGAGRGDAERFETVLSDDAGNQRHLEIDATPVVVDGESLLLLVLRDIGEQKRFEREITHLAYHDSLTGLPNRRQLKQCIAERVAAVAEHGGQVALLLLDLDRFKRVNDSLGHAAGDELLRAVAVRLARLMPTHALLARLGGDEFAVVSSAADPLTAVDLAHEIVASVTEPIPVGDHQLHVGCSVGVARCPEHAANLEGLLRAADVAMYQAKSRGGGVALFDSESDTFSAELLAMETALREALIAKAFTLVFQPVVALPDRSVLLWEALVRWPWQGEVLSAGRFLPLVEDLGLGAKLDEVVFHLVAAQLEQWDAEGFTPRVSVNVSAASLLRAESVSALERSLAELGSLASSLIIEVTETSLIDDWATVGAALARLRRFGLGVAVDDFGNGYASIAYLRQLPADIMKLDRSLVVALGRLDSGQRLVRALIQLGRAMGLTVIAEGVETAAQVEQLRELGCELLQGYHLARPMAPEDAAGWVPFALPAGRHAA